MFRRLGTSLLILPCLISVLVRPSEGALQVEDKWGTQGTGTGQFADPFAVAVDGTGHVYVVEADAHRVQKFTGDGVFVTSWGSQGTGVGQFSFPKGIAVDANGDVYVTDSDNNRVQKFSSSGAHIISWGSTGTGAGQFIQPRGIAAAGDGTIYVTEDGLSSKRVQRFNSSGVFMTQWGSNGTGDGQFSSPRGIAVDAAGNVYVTDAIADRVQKFSATGTFLTKWGTPGSGNGQLSFAIGAVCLGTHLLVVDSGNHRVQEFTATGSYVGQFGSFCRLSDGSGCVDPDGGGPLELGDGQFSSPRAIALDRVDHIFVLDSGNSRVVKLGDPQVIGLPDAGGPQGGLLRVRPNPFHHIVSLAVQIPESTPDAHAVLRVLDLTGREVTRLWDGSLSVGEHRFDWDGRTASGRETPEGIYFGVIELDGTQASAAKIVRVR